MLVTLAFRHISLVALLLASVGLQAQVLPASVPGAASPPGAAAPAAGYDGDEVRWHRRGSVRKSQRR